MHAAIAVALAATLLALPARATAGQYEVHSCRLPDGTSIGLVGWLPDGGVDPYFDRTDTCGADGGYFDARMEPRPTHPSGARRAWLFNLYGTDVRLRRMRARVAMTTRAPANPMANIVDALAYAGQGNFSLSNGAWRGTIGWWDDPSNAIDTGIMTPAPGYLFGVRCQSGETNACGPLPGAEPKAFVRVFRTEATLEDLIAPAVASFGGALAAAGPHRGREAFTLRASDRGAGVYRLLVELDRREVLRTEIDGNGGRCADQVPGGSAYDFIAPIPCKLDVEGTFELDTTRIPDGSYSARFVVEDAAGNERVAFGPVNGWEVDNVPPPRAPATAPPRVDTRTAAELYLGCGRRALSLIAATARGSAVRLSGVVAARHRSDPIAIYDSGRRVATTYARGDGFFEALVPRPARRRFARARFQAGVAGVRSVALKLPQDLATRSIGLVGDSRTIEVTGAVRHRGHRPVTVRRIRCGRYSAVAGGLTDARGRYRIRFAAPRARAGLYRVETRVRGARAYARARAIDLGDPGSG
jgi:hypothetical protein